MACATSSARRAPTIAKPTRRRSRTGWAGQAGWAGPDSFPADELSPELEAGHCDPAASRRRGLFFNRLPRRRPRAAAGDDVEDADFVDLAQIRLHPRAAQRDASRRIQP